MYLKQLLEAGKRYEFSEAASFVRVLQSDLQSALRITFYRQGREIDTVENVGRGYAERFEGEPFDKIAFSTSADQSVEIVIRLSQTCTYDTPPVGDVNVNNFPANQVVTVSNPDAQKRYDQYGASFKSTAVMTANVAEKIVDPAANVNGLIVWSASFSERQTSQASSSAILAKASAPTNVVDGDVIVGSESIITAGSLNFTCNNGRLPNAIRVPAGKGLYYITGANQDGSHNARSVLYTLL